MSTGKKERHSQAKRAEIPTDPEEIARIEARNAVRQFDGVVQMIADALADTEKTRFRLRPSMICTLNRLAVEGLEELAGTFRPGHVQIGGGSTHIPPPGAEVQGLVEDMCDYVNDNWARSAIHLCSYLMWRNNWIHPFEDGNGRTTRAISYVVLCVRSGTHLPGVKTIPEQISDDKFPYYDALDGADAAWKNGHVDVGAMETLLEGMLANQLAHIIDVATVERQTGRPLPSASPQ